MSARKQKAAATPAEQSALDALQAVLDEERVAHVATRLRLEREVEALRSRIGELEGELAQSAARIRELDSRLQARAR
ncbi:MAG TPA: hypothetical protein VN947_33450 [Polyangia bacterium]|nr:hypothetical protein [Polyangia bacterium]